MSGFIRAIASLVTILVAGCAAVMPPYLGNPQANRRFPPGEYVCYTASSAESMADAEVRAKKGVAEQVRSKITAVSKSYQRETRRGGEAAYSSDDRVVVEVETSFTHAEMIAIDPGSCGRYEGRYYAFAYLPKNKFLALAASEYKKDAIPFRKAVERAGREAGLGGFATAYATARAQIGKMRAEALAIRAVTGRPFEAFDKDERDWEDLLSQRSERLEKSRISVTVEAVVGQDEARALESKLCTALGALGLSATSGGDCQNGLLLRVKVSHACRAGSFGPDCSLALDAEIRKCGAENVLLRADLSAGIFRGSSTQTEAKALKAAWNSVNGDDLKKNLRKSLAAVLPL